MKILITGGLGAVGAPLADELRKRRNEVLVCDLVHSGGPNYIRCDVSRYRQLENLFEVHKFDYVYHLAAEFGRNNGEDFYENLWMTNAVGTKNMLKMQEKHGFKMIFASSSEVYGDYQELMSEDVLDKYPIKQMNDYAITKWVNEMQVLNSAQRHGTQTVRVRLFNTYGPGEEYSEYRSVACVFCYRALHDMPYTVYLKHHRQSTYIIDCINTLANIVDNFKAGEVYNIAGEEYHDIKYLSDLILDYLGKDDSNVIYTEVEPYNTINKKADTTKAKKDLKHNPKVALKEGIPITIEWMRKRYNI